MAFLVPWRFRPEFFSARAQLLLCFLLLLLASSGAAEGTGGTDSDGPVKGPGDDISATGACAPDVGSFCAGVEPGGNSLVSCLDERRKQEALGEHDDGMLVSKECWEEVRAFKVRRARDVRLDNKLFGSCQEDMSKFCTPEDEDFGFGILPMLGCLREHETELRSFCQEEVLRAMRDAAQDFELDPEVYDKCSADAGRLCPHAELQGGQVQACLRANRSSLRSEECWAALSRQEREDAADIRLMPALQAACVNDKAKFCEDVKPGGSHVLDCLEEHRLDLDFSSDCKREVEAFMARRSVDWTLDAHVAGDCQLDHVKFCKGVPESGPELLSCLEGSLDAGLQEKCLRAIHKVVQRAGMNMQFSAPLARHCKADRDSLCRDVSPGEGRLLSCLQTHRDRLSEPCQMALFDQEMVFAEEIDFKWPLRMACQEETRRFCSGLNSGHGVLLKCLQDKQADSNMGEGCKTELERDEVLSAQDYRLNYRLRRSCAKDVSELCSSACPQSLNAIQTCGGKVLKCLQTQMGSVSSACRAEVFAFEEQEARNIELDVPLMDACRSDIANLCPAVRADHAGLLRCLRARREVVQPECREEEERFSEMEATDIRLTPTLMNACGTELQLFCRSVDPSHGIAFRCLQENLADVHMGSPCRAEVNLQELRKASNYRLDVRVREACAGDATHLCLGEDSGTEGHALMYRCFVRHFKDLNSSCASEVAYAVRMALWEYKVNASLTAPCDTVAQEQCHRRGELPPDSSGVILGYVGQCLMDLQHEKLSGQCAELVAVASAPGAYPRLGGSVDGGDQEAHLAETLAKIEELQKQNNHAWLATGAIVAGLVFTLLVVSLVGLLLWRLYNPLHQPYVVIKGGDL